MPLVAFDSRDARAAPLRGWGRYAFELARALPRELVREYDGGSRLPELLWEQITFPLRLTRDRADLVHSPNCFLPLVRPCPGVVTIHDLAFEVFPEDFAPRTRAKYRSLTPRAARSAERVICVSAFTAADVVARYGIDEAKVRVIPNAPCLPLGRSSAPGRPAYVLAVGDLRPKKNLDRLIDAWALAATGHELVLAGLGTLDRPLPPGVSAPGYLGDDELDALIRGADLLVHPSLYEGFGLVVVEAMTRGTPVACADATALPETAGGAAELFDPYDVSAIAAGIDRALGRSDELRALGRARAAQLSWEASAAQTVAVYEELL